MKRIVVSVASAALGLGAVSAAHAYSATADVTFTWGNANGTQIAWTSSGANTLSEITNDTYFHTLTGNNSTAYFNSDFAAASDGDNSSTADDCLTPPAGYDTIALRKYGCRISDVANGYYSPIFNYQPLLTNAVASAGPLPSATGTLTVNDTSLTGTLTVISTTDLPTGGTAASSGDGANGYNVRSADGSPFGNVWYGVTTTATLTVDLTGTFSATSWDIDGGSVRISDAAFLCQQGGFSTPNNLLCLTSSGAGGADPTGSQLTWGWDIDGGNTGTTATGIVVKNADGSTILDTLSGVRAVLAIDGAGSISTTQGEYRSGSAATVGGITNCGVGAADDHIRWNSATTSMSCGTIASGALDVTGTVTPGFETGAFIDQTGVALSTVIESNEVGIVGQGTGAAISVVGGEYSIGCNGTFTGAAGTIDDGQTVCVRQTSSASAGTTTDAILTVGSASDTFSVTTLDDVPDAFTFASQTGVALSTVVTSAAATISGISGSSAVTVANGEYSVGCTGTFTGAAGTISNGQTVCVRHTSSAAFETDTVTTLTIGGVDGTFTSTTLVEDTTPAAFTFTTQTNVARSTVITSSTATITGINSPAAVTVAGGEYSVGCTGTFTAAAGTINDGETVCVRHTSAAGFSADTVTTLTIGGVDGTFTSTTEAADTTPSAFSFTDVTDADLDTEQVSDAITVAGINTTSPITVTGGEYSINGGAYTAAAGTVVSGDTVRVRHTSASDEGTDTDTTLTIGGISDTFTSTTLGGEAPPTGLREDDGGSSLDALVLALLGMGAFLRRRAR